MAWMPKRRYGRIAEDVVPVDSRGGVPGLHGPVSVARKPYRETPSSEVAQALDDQWRYESELADHPKSRRLDHGHGRPDSIASRS